MSTEERKLFSVEDITPYIKQRHDGDEALLEIIIDAATRWIERYCNCTFATDGVAYSETYDGDNKTVLYLNHRPIISVSLLVITDSADVDDTIPSSDYKIYSTVGKIVLTESDTFLKGDLNVAVTYTAGESALPPDVKLAGMQLVRWYYRKWSDNRDGISSITAGDITTTYEKDVPQAIKEMLNPHRKIAIG